MLKINVKAIAFGVIATLLVSCMDEPQLTTLEKSKVRNAKFEANPSAVTFYKDKFIIIANTNQLSASLEADVAAAGGIIDKKMDVVGLATARSSDPNFRAKAGKIAGIRSVIPDFTAQWLEPISERIISLDAQVLNPPASGDDDALFDLQWGHAAVNAPAAWNAGYKGEGTLVADLDSGFDLDHPDLAGNIVGAVSFVPGQGPGYAPADRFSRGTHTAGTIAALDNGLGTIGIAPKAKLLLVKVLGDAGSGDFSWILNGILYATSQGADVINMSLGALLPRNGKFYNPDGSFDNFTKEIQEIIVAISRVTNYARQNGTTVIAAAGNSALNLDKVGSWITIPAEAPTVVSISATAPIGWAMNPSTNLDIFTDYSNYGNSGVSFAAPGGNVWTGIVPITDCTVAGITRSCYVFDLVYSTGSSLTPGEALYYWSAGTSMAAPHATGVAALIIGKNGGSMAPSAVEAKLRASADDLGKPGQDPFYGYGRVNALRAVQ